MYLLRYDVSGDYDIRLPADEGDLVPLAEAYIRYEATLPPADALHDIPCVEVQAALAAVKSAQAAQLAAEADRTSAANRWLQTSQQARTRLDRLIIRLKSRHVHNLADLGRYGLRTRLRQRGGLGVRKPANALDWLKFLNDYLVEAGRQPEAERVTDPSFEELTQLAQTLNTALEQRVRAQTRRQTSVRARKAASQRLRNLLQVAAAIRIVKQYGGTVSVELAKWGYTVVARK